MVADSAVALSSDCGLSVPEAGAASQRRPREWPRSGTNPGVLKFIRKSSVFSGGSAASPNVVDASLSFTWTSSPEGQGHQGVAFRGAFAPEHFISRGEPVPHLRGRLRVEVLLWQRHHSTLGNIPCFVPACFRTILTPLKSGQIQENAKLFTSCLAEYVRGYTRSCQDCSSTAFDFSYPVGKVAGDWHRQTTPI